jgi:hypothetical protein
MTAHSLSLSLGSSATVSTPRKCSTLPIIYHLCTRELRVFGQPDTGRCFHWRRFLTIGDGVCVLNKRRAETQLGATQLRRLQRVQQLLHFGGGVYAGVGGVPWAPPGTQTRSGLASYLPLSSGSMLKASSSSSAGVADPTFAAPVAGGECGTG